MQSYVIKLFHHVKGGGRAYIKGNAYFRTNREKIWSKLFLTGLQPKDSYIIFYIMENAHKSQIAVSMGEATVNGQGKISFERNLDNKILDGYRFEEEDIIAVILIDKKDKNMERPIIGFRNKKIDWRNLVGKYIADLEYNHDNYYEDYNRNEEYDRIIDSLPESTKIEKRDKIDKAVEIKDLSKTNFGEMLSGIELHKESENILLIRMKTGNFYLYMLGLPDNFSSEKRIEYIENGFKAFLSKSAEKALNSHSDGYWCKYI